MACYVAKPERGGVAGAFGVAEEVSDVSIACRQVGPIRFKEPVPLQEDAFNERRSLIFKTLHVVRMVDVSRNTLVHLTYSDRIISGSAKNSVCGDRGPFDADSRQALAARDRGILRPARAATCRCSGPGGD